MLPYDYYVLWSTPPGGDRAPFFALQEEHLKILHRSPPLIGRILNIAIGTGLLGFIMKLFKPSEANLLFDGASLVLYMCGVVVYLSNIVKGLRIATIGLYGDDAKAAAGIVGSEYDDEFVSKEDSLRIMAASNTILALVLVGVLILQAGQWYAQRKEDEELTEMRRKKASGEGAVTRKGASKKKAN
jgi:hypothetical protein